MCASSCAHTERLELRQSGGWLSGGARLRVLLKDAGQLLRGREARDDQAAAQPERGGHDGRRGGHLAQWVHVHGARLARRGRTCADTG